MLPPLRGLQPAVLALSCVACMRPGEFPTCESDLEAVSLETTPTWSDDMASLVFDNCTGCHVEGGPAPFALEDYNDARKWANAMADAVEARSMPPTGPTNCGECQSFSNAPWLTDEQIVTFRAWADADAPEGVLDDAPTSPGLEQHPLPRIDALLTLDQSYQPEGTTDDYRCFVVDPELEGDRFLTGFSVDPDNAEAVHHVILYGLYSDEDKALARELEAEDDRYGFGCFGTSGIDEAPMLAAWAPGTPPIQYPEGTGVRLTENVELIMQVHYHLDRGDTAPDQSAMELMLEESVDNEAVLYPLGNWEFELEPGQSEVSDEQYAAGFIGPVGEIQLHAVAPHMHTRGVSMQVEVGQGKNRECLLDVPQWDFDWQGLYFYEKPVTIKGGASTRISCTWDTTDAEDTIEWGDGTEDEMCLAIFYVTGLPQKRVDAWYSAFDG